MWESWTVPLHDCYAVATKKQLGLFHVHINFLFLWREGITYDFDHIMRTYHRASLKLHVTINITVNGSFKELESFKLLVYTFNGELLHYIALYSWYYCHNIKLKMYINFILTAADGTTDDSWWFGSSVPWPLLAGIKI